MKFANTIAVGNKILLMEPHKNVSLQSKNTMMHLTRKISSSKLTRADALGFIIVVQDGDSANNKSSPSENVECAV